MPDSRHSPFPHCRRFLSGKGRGFWVRPVKCGVADPMLPAQVSNQDATLGLADHAQPAIAYQARKAVRTDGTTSAHPAGGPQHQTLSEIDGRECSIRQ